MSKMRFLFVSIGLGLIVTTSVAHADIRVTLTSGDGNQQQQYSAKGAQAFSGFFDVAGYDFTLSTSMSNYPGTANLGQLSSSLSVLPSITDGSVMSLQNLQFKVEEITTSSNPATAGLATFTGPNSTNGYTITNSLGLNSTGAVASGNATVNDMSGDTLMVTGLSTNKNSFYAPNNQGYTLSQTFTLGGLTSESPSASLTFITKVNGASSTPAVVPEPSSFLLTGLATICVGGYSFCRRRRARPI